MEADAVSLDSQQLQQITFATQLKQKKRVKAVNNSIVYLQEQ